MERNAVNVLAAVGKTGYGVAGFNVLRTLRERGWYASLFPKGTNHQRSGPEAELIVSAMVDAELFDHDAPSLNLWHQFDLGPSVGRGKRVAWPIFELDRFNSKEVHHLQYPDQLVVCSDWAKNVVLNNLGEKSPDIQVVPLGIDPYVFNSSAMWPRNLTSDDRTVFLNCGKWEVRKGHDILAEAFNKAFNPSDPVELWLLPFNPFLSAQEQRNWERMYVNSAMGEAGKIKILPWQDTHEEVAKIMAQADCGVFPSRAEGWNLELLEMMAMGKPVIATNFTAHTEFCNEDNSLLINVDGTESAFDGKWFFDQGDWAELGDPQIEQLISHMRSVYQKCHEDGIYVNDAGIETGKKFTWDHSVDLLEEVLA